MAADKMTDEDFAGKIDWEGGLFEATFSYGLKADDLLDTDGELYKAMVEFDTWRESGRHIVARVQAALPEE